MIISATSLIYRPMSGPMAEAEMAVVSGDPFGLGPFTSRFKFPRGFIGAVHSHPVPEFITIFSGRGRMAFGLEGTYATAGSFEAGSFLDIGAGVWHAFWVEDDMECELHSVAPYTVIPPPA